MTAVCNNKNYYKSTNILALTMLRYAFYNLYNATTKKNLILILRTVLGTKTLSEILAEREAIAAHVLKNLVSKFIIKRIHQTCPQEIATDQWGVHVSKVEIKDVKLPVQMQRTMAAEGEATREARSKVLFDRLGFMAFGTAPLCLPITSFCSINLSIPR